MAIDYFSADSLIQFLAYLRTQDVDPKEYKLHIDKYLNFKARRKGIPISGQFELTPLCNLDCKMCYVHLNGTELGGKSLLPVERWKDLMRQAHEAGMLSAGLSGGECLTYPGFEELYIYLHRMGVNVTVLTNGVLIDDDKIRLFQKYPVSLVRISLYGSCDDAYENVTGHRAFSRVYDNLKRLRDAKLPVSVAVTPNGLMYDDFKALLRVITDLQIPYNINYGLIAPREGTGRGKIDLTDEQYLDIYKYSSELNDEHLETVDIGELPDEGTDAVPQSGLICSAGRSSFNIRWDGVLSACASLYDVCEDLSGTTFAEAWKRLNHKANTYLRPGECNDCAYNNSCNLCAAMHRDSGSPGHCDRRICARTKKMIAEGLIKMPSSIR